jgi:hypothetical protein
VAAAAAAVAAAAVAAGVAEAVATAAAGVAVAAAVVEAAAAAAEAAGPALRRCRACRRRRQRRRARGECAAAAGAGSPHLYNVRGGRKTRPRLTAASAGYSGRTRERRQRGGRRVHRNRNARRNHPDRPADLHPRLGQRLGEAEVFPSLSLASRHPSRLARSRNCSGLAVSPGLVCAASGETRFPVVPWTAGVGFEPTGRLAAANSFQDCPVRPLRHPAGGRIVASCRA